MTDVEGVFASGGKSVVCAMAAGSRAAEAVDAYLARRRAGPRPRRRSRSGADAGALPTGYGGPTWTL